MSAAHTVCITTPREYTSLKQEQIAEMMDEVNKSFEIRLWRVDVCPIRKRESLRYNVYEQWVNELRKQVEALLKSLFRMRRYAEEKISRLQNELQVANNARCKCDNQKPKIPATTQKRKVYHHQANGTCKCAMDEKCWKEMLRAHCEIECPEMMKNPTCFHDCMICVLKKLAAEQEIRAKLSAEVSLLKTAKIHLQQELVAKNSEIGKLQMNLIQMKDRFKESCNCVTTVKETLQGHIRRIQREDRPIQRSLDKLEKMKRQVLTCCGKANLDDTNMVIMPATNAANRRCRSDISVSVILEAHGNRKKLESEYQSIMDRLSRYVRRPEHCPCPEKTKSDERVAGFMMAAACNPEACTKHRRRKNNGANVPAGVTYYRPL